MGTRVPQGIKTFTCPDCGLKLFGGLKAHQGKKPCRAAKAAKEMREQGYINIKELARVLVANQVPGTFQQYVHTAPSGHSPWESNPQIFNEYYLPAWACALILAGHWTETSVNNAASDQELQQALSIEYAIKREAG
jgi:hypothetical protein